MLNFNIINPVVWVYPDKINFLHSDEEYNMALDWSFYIIVASLVPLYFVSLKIAHVFADKLKVSRGKIAHWWATARKMLFYGVFIRSFQVIYIKVCYTFGLQVQFYLRGSRH